MREGTIADDGKSVAQFPVPDPPKNLDKAAALEWRRLAGWMREQGLLRDADLSLFEQRCKIVSELRADEKIVARKGATYEHKGVYRTRPEVRRISDNRKQLRAIDSEFGLTPAARARVGHVTGGAQLPKQPELPGVEAARSASADPAAAAPDLAKLSDADYFRGPPN